MNDLIKLAICKSFEKDTKTFRPAVGTHAIDQTFTVKVSGTLRKLADVEYTPTVDIPLLPTMALVLEKAGFQRELAKRLLIEAMTEALTLDQKGEEFVGEKVKDIREAMEHVREVTAALPKKVKTGGTSVSVTVEYA